jgi:DNA repair exonuclease SbcCD ATPase subunit
LSHEVILGKAADFCPLCQQSIPHDHLATLEENLQRIRKAMSGKVDEYKGELESLMEMCAPFNIDLSGVGDHFADERNDVNKAVDALNRARVQIRLTLFSDILGKSWRIIS